MISELFAKYVYKSGAKQFANTRLLVWRSARRPWTICPYKFQGSR